MRIALLGAESTGKSQLAVQLAAHLRSRGLAVTLVAEVLREWCDRAGRTPLREEQEGIAREQASRADAAPRDAWLVADTTPLMIAVYSDLLFGDRALYGLALAHQRGYDLTMVTGLDLPWVADGLMRDGPEVRVPVDALVRSALDRAGLPYQVLYGCGEDRLSHALIAIESIARCDQGARTAGQIDQKIRPNSWFCESCGDPDCERRLFSRFATTAARG